MNVQAEIKWITMELQKSKDPSIILYLKNFLVSLRSDEQSNDRISLEQYNREIDEIESLMEKGKGISQDDIERESESW